MSQKLLTRTLAVVLFFGFLLPLWAQTGSRVQKQSVAIFVDTGPTVDGVLDDPVWEQSAPLSDLQQRDPQEGAPASEYTTVRIVYTKDAIYFGFRCDDSEPAAIIATERRRDQDLTKDDSVAVILDTFHDRRNAFLFRTNSLGTQFDALLTEEGLDINVSWDEKWEAEANRSEEGWTVELMIPFKSLRMGPQGEWGLEIERLIRRKNEAAYWNTYSRDFKFEEVSQAGLLSGLEEASQGLRWRIK
ncbi:carbohydrate binding family 9 domain-containing protein, partial [bacterium]|nr:carbohydrate binding family 9 domain-containing protein [bacterium]